MATRILLLLITVFLFSFSGNAQTAQLSPDGSASALKGKVYILSVFVTEQAGIWTLDEKLDLSQKQAEVEKWLKKNSSRYGVNLDFNVGSFGVDEEIVIDNLDVLNSDGVLVENWVPRVLSKIGYSSPEEFYSLAQEIYQAEQVVVLVYANRNGTSYALTYAQGKSAERFVEGSYIPRNYDDGSPIQAASIGQEILRLFGAWDLFDSGLISQEKAAEAGRLYPNDIMHRIAFDLNELEINELTAWRIGWISQKPAFESFKPARR